MNKPCNLFTPTHKNCHKRKPTKCTIKLKKQQNKTTTTTKETKNKTKTKTKTKQLIKIEHTQKKWYKVEKAFNETAKEVLGYKKKRAKKHG